MDDDWNILPSTQDTKVKPTKRVLAFSPTPNIPKDHLQKPTKNLILNSKITDKPQQSSKFSSNKKNPIKVQPKLSYNSQLSNKSKKVSSNNQHSSPIKSKNPFIMQTSSLIKKDPIKNSKSVNESKSPKKNCKTPDYLNKSRLSFPIEKTSPVDGRFSSPYDPKIQRKKIFDDSFDFANFEKPEYRSPIISNAEEDLTQRPRTRSEVSQIHQKSSLNQNETFEISMFYIPEEFSNLIIKELLKGFQVISITIDANSKNGQTKGILKTRIKEDIQGIIVKLRKFGISAQVNSNNYSERSHLIEFFTENKEVYEGPSSIRRNQSKEIKNLSLKSSIFQ